MRILVVILVLLTLTMISISQMARTTQRMITSIPKGEKNIYSNDVNFGIRRPQKGGGIYSTMQDVVEYRNVSLFGSYPGRIEQIIFVNGVGHIIVGRDYVSINETKSVLHLENIKYVTVGDLDLDGSLEIVVLTNQSIYALRANLSLIWFAGVDYSYAFDRVLVANITSSVESLVVLWRYGQNIVAYYSANGTFLRVDTISSSVSVEMLDVDFVGEYLLCKTRDQSYILAWKYGSTQAQIVYGFVASGLSRINGSVYAVGYRLSVARIVRFYVSGGELAFDEQVIESGVGISSLIYTNEELLVGDITNNGKVEFVIWNSTNMIAIYNGSSQLSYRIAEIPSTKKVFLSRGWVFLLCNSTLYVYSSELVFRGSLAIRDSIGVLGEEAIVYCRDGSAFRINVGIDIRLEPLSLWAGWSVAYSHKQLTFYNGLLISIIGEKSWIVKLNHSISKVFVDRAYVIVLLDEGSILVITGGQIIWRGKVGSGHEFIDGVFLENKNAVALADNKANIVYVNSTSQYKFLSTLTNNIILADVASDGDNYFVLEGNWSTDRVNVYIYRNKEVAYLRSYSFSNLTHADIRGQIFDGDNDGIQNIAYEVYMENATKASVHLSAIEGTATLWSQYINSTIASKDKFNAFVAGERYVYIINATKFLIYPSLGIELNLNGTKTWVSDGILLATEESAIITTKGIVYLGLGGSLCWGLQGALTKVLIYRNYGLYQAAVGLDSGEPSGGFENINNGSTIRESSFNISWYSTDDLEVANVTLFIDSNVIFVGEPNDTVTVRGLGEGEHTLNLRIVDIVGRASWVNVTIIIDLPIEMQIYLENNTVINTTSLKVPIILIGNITNLAILLNDTLYGNYNPFNGTINLTFVAEGTWAVRFEATGYRDKLVEIYIIKVDLTPPELVFVFPNNTIINTTDLPLHINISAYATDNMGIKEVYLYSEGIWIPLPPEINISLIFESEGTYVLRFKVTDYAGLATRENFVITINAIASFVIRFDYNGTWLQNNTISFVWESRFVDYVEVYLENNFIGKVDPNGTMTLEIGDGVWVLRLLAVGFMDRNLRSILVKIDTKPPIIAMMGIQNNTEVIVDPFSRELEVYVNITDNIGVENVTILINGTLARSLDGKIRVRVEEGLYIIEIMARDYAGLERKVRFLFRVVYEKNEASFLELIVIILSMLGGLITGLYVVKRRLGSAFEGVRRS